MDPPAIIPVELPRAPMRQPRVANTFRPDSPHPTEIYIRDAGSRKSVSAGRGTWEYPSVGGNITGSGSLKSP